MGTTLGWQFRPRDKYGRRIPAEGTLARQVYGLMVQGFTKTQIAQMLNRSDDLISATMYRLIYPDRYNAKRRAQRDMWYEDAQKIFRINK
jgi:hypothetical protein